MAHNSAPFGASHRGEKGVWLTMVKGQPHAIVHAVGTGVGDNSNTPAAGAGCFFGFGSEINKAFPSDSQQTEERAQWRAVLQGLLQIYDNTSMRRAQVRMTSERIMSIMDKSLIPMLKQNGWKWSNGETVKYEDLIEQVEETVAKFDSVDWLLLDAGSDPFIAEAERMAHKEAKHWQSYFRGYDSMFD